MKIEISSKKGLENLRHFVVKWPGPMADSLFRSESIGFLENM